jgi:Zn-dependent peptidase ImmA (M78 family)/DNA-binding XRE family transcriptional regulator
MDDSSSRKHVGRRVQAARRQKGWSQEQLTNALGFNDRQTVSEIEIGKRNLRPEELVALAELFDFEIDYFLDPFSIAGEAKFSWRTNLAWTDSGLREFEHRVSKLIGMLRWIRAEAGRPSNPLKQSLRLAPKSSYEAARARGEELADLLDLGEAPATKLAKQIEDRLDIPVLYIDVTECETGRTISGAACHLDDFTSILINRHESEGRRHFDLAHELFHALTWEEMEPRHQETFEGERPLEMAVAASGKVEKRIEALADNFASAILMPEKILKAAKTTSIGALADLATKLRVAPQALAWRLFNLGRIDEKTRAALGQRSLHAEHPQALPLRLSPNFVNMLHSALARGRLSVRKAARTLELTPLQLEALFAEYGMAAPFDQ